MAVRFYDKVYMRPAGARLTTIAKSTLASGWTLLPGKARVTQDTVLKTEKDVEVAMGDGTDYIGSEAAITEMALIGWSGTDLASIRTELVNKLVDIVVYDSNLGTSGWAVWGTQVYPTPDVSGGQVEKIQLTGKVRYASDQAHKMVSIALT